EIFENRSDWPEDFSSLTPTEVVHHVLPTPMIRGRKNEHYALRMFSSLIVPHDGVYTFSSAVKSAMRFYLDDRLVIENDKYQEVRKDVRLKRGPVKLQFDYLSDPEHRYMSFAWAGPGFARQRVSAEAFDRSARIESIPQTADLLEPGGFEEVEALTFRRTYKAVSSNAWFCLRADRGGNEFGEYFFELKVNGEAREPMAPGSNRTYTHSSSQYTDPLWWLGDHAGESVELELKVSGRGYPGQNLPGLAFDQFGFGPGQYAPPAGIGIWAGSWWLQAADSKIHRSNHQGPLHGARGLVRVAEDGSFFIDFTLPSGARSRTVGSLREEDGRMVMDYAEDRWTDDVVRMAEDGKSFRIVEELGDDWNLVMARSRDARFAAWRGRWYLVLEQSVIRNETYQGSMVGGKYGLSIADDGSVSAHVRYPNGVESRVVGQAKPNGEGLIFQYNDDDWSDDRVRWDPDTESLHVQEIGNEENWNLVFKRTGEKY
ncbi:MAG: PA14 domain-containing protein, partial [Verrucomicrobiota bacterium]